MIEKIEVAKGKRSFYYTGILRQVDKSGWIAIRTIYGEILHFRKEQIMQRRELSESEKDLIKQKIGAEDFMRISVLENARN